MHKKVSYVKIKNDLENKIKQEKANNEILVNRNELLIQKANKYKALRDKVNTKNEKEIMKKNKLKINMETPKYNNKYTFNVIPFKKTLLLKKNWY
jgi:hypothetical protein